MVQHNIPFNTAAHLSSLFADIFPDSAIAKNYGSAKTKTSCIANGALAPHFLEETVTLLQQQPFTLNTDGSNDTGIIQIILFE